MTLTNYSDTTPDVSIKYEPLGRISSETSLVSSVSQSSVSYTYNPTTLALDKETITYDIDTNGTPELTRILDRSQDTLLRESGWVLGSTPASGVGGGATPPPELVTSYAYNPTDGRLETIRGGGLHPPSQFSYSYVPNSNLLATITGPAHTVTNTYEPNRDVLASKQNKAGTNVVSRYDYSVNAIGQRSNVATSGTAFASSRDIAWGYDGLGQVTSADSTIPGLDRAYQFDLIGNRLKTADSLTLPIANNYTPNALNQYSSITNPQSAILNPLHDADGNMTSGPLPANVNANSTLVWDGENRLIQATVGMTGSVVRYSYDAQSRRIAETVGSTTKITIYDGWNPIAEYWRAGLQPASLAKSFTWGIDLSGTLQGAGGVGGLLAVTDSTGTYFPTFDGNGNVSEYLDSTGAIAAHYEYDPFGRTTVATGPKAQDFAHRFSTKPLDATTGLYYYGYRFYDPVTGRWPSRDPIGERGGMNLYGFGPNTPISGFDYLGKYWMKPTPGTVGNLARRIPDDLGRLVDRDYGGKKVDPGPPSGDCVEDIAKTIAWYEELVEAGFPTGDAEARLNEVLERCKQRPPAASSEPYDPNCCCCKSGVWKGAINYWSAGFILNFGNFSGTLTCEGEPEKKMYVEGLVVGSGFFAGWTGDNIAKDYTMYDKCPSDIVGTSQGGIFSIGGGIGPLGIASADFPMNASPGGDSSFGVPNINVFGVDFPDISAPKPFKPSAKAGIGFNMTGHRVDVARCE